MLKIGRTFYLDSKIIKAISALDLDLPREHKFIGVHLYLDSSPEISIFSSADDLFLHAQNKDNYYCYLEYEESLVYILEKAHDESIIGAKNVYCASGEWRLFINSKMDIVVQQDKPKTTNTYFRYFPLNQNFYLSLSYLYHTLRNYKFDDNLTVKSKFESLTKK